MRNTTYLFLVFLIVVVPFVANAQFITGPASVALGSTTTYSYNTGAIIFSPQWRLDIGRGTLSNASQNGTEYTIAITWTSAGNETIAFLDGVQEKSRLDIIVVSPPPPVPTALEESNPTTSSFTANWTSVTGANNYRLDVSTASNFSPASTFVTGYSNRFVSASGHVVTGLTANTTYYYRVRSESLTGSVSASSNVITAVTGPPSPVAVSATDITHESFTANWQSVAGATAYTIDVSTASNFSDYSTWTAGAGATSVSIPGLLGDTRYYFRVRAYNGVGSSTYSNVISLVTLVTAPLAYGATNITASSFQANWGTVPGATTYLVDVSNNSSFTSFLSGWNNASVGNTTSATVTGLTMGVTYYYRVRAQNSGWTTSSSNVVTVGTIPGNPTINLPTLITSTSFTANWYAASNATSYRLDVSTDMNFGSYVSGYQNFILAGTSQNVTGLMAGTTYYYRARASNSAGSSGNSAVMSVILVPPPPVSAAATVITDNSFTANWAASLGAAYYRLDVSTQSNFSTFIPNHNNVLVHSTSYTVTGLATGTTYYYRVRAVNASGTSSNSANISVVTILNPPVAVKAGEIASSAFTANWNSTPNATSYRLDVSTRTDFVTRVPNYDNLIVSGTNVRVTGLLPKTTYYYRVRAANTAATSVSSNVIVAVDLDQNYIRTIDLTVPGKTSLTQVESATINERMTNYNFFDGLGRSVQSVTQQGSPSLKDIVDAVGYDAFGRQTKKYLPYTDPDETNGWYKVNALRDLNSAGSEENQYRSGKQYQFFQSGGVLAKDRFPYSETRFEPSTLDRVIKQGSPGETWQPNATNTYGSTDRTVKLAYESNLFEEVLRWSYTSPTATYPLGLVNASWYNPNQLYKNKTKDENNNEVIEFTDKDKKIVLKKVQASGGQWAQTYYIYDEFGSLVCVIPPEATAKLSTDYHHSGATDASKDSFLKRWAFRYTYDARRRMTQKQVPGADPVYMVYDKRDRIVLTQDGKQRSLATKYWTFTKYDEFNRPILTGIKDTAAALTQSQMQNQVDLFYNKAWAKLFEIYVGSAAGNVHGYSNKSYPVVNAGATSDVNRYLTVTYYDKYDFRSTWIGSYAYSTDGLSQTVGGVTYSQPPTGSENLRIVGQVTGTKIKVLDGGVAGGYTWLKTISYYDDKSRVIQVQSDNYKAGIDRVSTLYDFAGKILLTKTTHIERDVTWKDIVAAKVEGNRLFRTATSDSWGGSGAASVQQLPASQNGWIEVTASETTTARMVGLSDVNTDANYTTIDYAIYPKDGGALYVYENGTQRGQFGTYIAGDILKIERTGTSIKYYKNNTLIYTSTVPSSSVLMADAALYHAGTTLTNVRSSFSTTSRTITRRFEYDHAGRLLKTWHRVDAEPEILLSLNSYNELGQPVDKKLHSTMASGSDAKQSVDYRYNVRGWITSINNAELAANATNDEAGDYFGMNLAYDDNLQTGNSAQYNGNISGMKWSVNQGLGTIKSMAYNYTYDTLNRLSNAIHKQATTLGTWVTGQYEERGFTYDLNGNLRKLVRKGDNRVLIDSLSYNYGTGATASNKLLYVLDLAPDAVKKWKGFYDGNPGTAIDYTYDANGNMITDLNKGISSAIAYNYLNLPEVILKGGNSVKYFYDATGRKLSQVTTFGTLPRQTDYVGEFTYENDVLQFIGHEEGRIVVASEQVIYADACDNIANKTASNATLTAMINNGENYVRVSANGTVARTGVFPIGGSIPVVAGDRYRIKARGYGTGANVVYLSIKGNGADIGWPGGALPNSVTTESWTEQMITIPSGVTTLQAGVTWAAPVAGAIFYLNDFVIEKISSITPEYQYFLKDHLGNVRVTFTTKDETSSYTASLEDNTQNTEQASFRNYTRVTNDLFDHTDAGTTYNKVQLLNGGINAQVGLTKSLAVMPGDVITAQVYAKHYGATGSSGNLAGFAAALLSAFGIPAPVAGETGTAAAALQSYGSFIASGGNPGNNSWPKGFLNILVFNKNYALVDVAYQQLDAAYVQAVGSTTKAPHQLLSRSVTVKEPGYVYIYLSNEGSVQKDIYFDDVSISHVKSKIVQNNDYYPFGLTFNSYQCDHSFKQDYRYNGKEFQDELDLKWLDYGARMYTPELGRWGVIDPYVDIYESVSAYSYVENNPAVATDPDGRLVIYVNGFRPSAYFKWYFNPFDNNRSFGVPPPHEWHTTNWFREDQFDYWTEFSRDWQFEVDREDNYFVDGSNHANSTASSRFDKGRGEGNILAKKIKSGEITLEDGEFIKLVGHSMGAAHSIGMAQGLVDAGIDASLIKIFLYASHQPNQLGGIPGVEIFQAGRDGDRISSNGIFPSLLFSEHARIPWSEWVVLPDRPEEEWGGHYIQTYTTEEFKTANPALFQYFIDQEYINPDGTLKED